MPPAYLRVLTAGSRDIAAFVEVGRRAAEEFVRLAADHGHPFAAGARVLDFGCGCGRVARVVTETTPVELFGCDINPEMIAWCQAHLAGRFAVNSPEPPAPYADAGSDAGFDIVYAVSVFTHLSEARAQAWLAELARVTRPGGLALITFWDEHAPAADGFRADLIQRGFHLKRPGREGSNLFTGFFSHDGLAARAAAMWRRLDSVRSVDAACGQAIMVFERR